MALCNVPFNITMGGGRKRPFTRKKNISTHPVTLFDKDSNFSNNKKKSNAIIKKNIATRRRVIHIGNRKDRSKTLKKDKLLSFEIAKITMQKKREFLKKKGLLRCGSKTPGKTVDILMNTVGFKE